jgi:hypothetical protein
MEKKDYRRDAETLRRDENHHRGTEAQRGRRFWEEKF